MTGSSIALISCVWALGCAAGIRSNLNVSPVDPEWEVDELAILPVTSHATPGARVASTPEALARAIAARGSATRLVSARVVGRRIEEAGLLAEYTQALIALRETGVARTSVFEAIADAVGVRYLLLASFSYSREITSASFDTRQGIGTYAQIWDRGRVVWELDGLVSSETGEFTRERSGGDLAEAAVREIADRLPLRPSR